MIGDDFGVILMWSEMISDELRGSPMISLMLWAKISLEDEMILDEIGSFQRMMMASINRRWLLTLVA